MSSRFSRCPLVLGAVLGAWLVAGFAHGLVECDDGCQNIRAWNRTTGCQVAKPDQCKELDQLSDPEDDNCYPATGDEEKKLHIWNCKKDVCSEVCKPPRVPSRELGAPADEVLDGEDCHYLGKFDREVCGLS